MTARASALVGTLTDLALPDLLGFVARSQRSGIVRFTGPVAAEVHVAGGRVTFADTDGDPGVEAHLVAIGIAPDAVATAAEAASRGAPWGDALVDAGVAVTEARDAVREHTINALFEVLLASDDGFEFEPGEPSASPPRFSLDLDPLIDEIERRRRAWSRIAATVPSTAVVLRIAPALPPGTSSASVSASDWAVLATLDGRRMLSDSVRSLGRTSFQVCEAAHRLLSQGVVERA